MNMRTLVGLVCAALSLSAQAQKPRVALLLSADGRHHDEFDSALSALGWAADRYPCKADVQRTLAAKLGDYDLLLVAPLFNFGGEKVLPGEDRVAYMRFLENGGMIAVTDGSYEGVRAWLADIDPRFGGLSTGNCNSSQWAVNGVTGDAEPAHPLRFFPSRIREPNSWPHFLQPSPDAKWRVVATCSEGFPVTFAQTVGKGMVSLSALRQPSPKQLGNFYACLQLCRAGIALKSFDLSEPDVGDGNLKLEFEGPWAKEACGFVYEVVPEKGEARRFEGRVSGATFELPYHLSLRGPVTVRLLFKRGAQELPLFERKTVLPQLLTVTPNAYRGILATARRLPTVTFGVRLAPDQEDLKGASVGLTVLDSSGNQVAATNAVVAWKCGALSYRQPVLWPPSSAAGVFTVKAVLSGAKGKKLAEAETSVRILTPRPAQTIIDEDGTFLVDGKPFFPLGLYHVPTADYKDVAALGINTVQFWTWDADTDASGFSRGLAKASAAGLKTVFELNHKGESIFRDAAKAYADNSAILMWYGLDEPDEGSYGLAALLRDTYHEADPQHPVYTVSCRKDVYAEHASFADVFAIDPYGKPSAAAECLPLAQAALGGSKPLVCVPGAFGKDETPEEMRATAYLALASDARGIIWYPWNQMGGGPVGVGCKNSPAQQAAISNICAEVRSLLPYLFAPIRRPFASENGKLRCLYTRLDSQRSVLMVNSTPEKLEAEARLPAEWEAGTCAQMKDFFKKRNDVTAVKDGRFSVSLEPYETRVYVW